MYNHGGLDDFSMMNDTPSWLKKNVYVGSNLGKAIFRSGGLRFYFNLEIILF